VTDLVVNSGASLALQNISIIGGYSSGNGGDVNSAGTLAAPRCDFNAGLAGTGGGATFGPQLKLDGPRSDDEITIAIERELRRMFQEIQQCAPCPYGFPCSFRPVCSGRAAAL
jgi:hypothetical protein